MAERTEEVQVRPANELDISDIVLIDEKIGGAYRPEVWERRLGYYLRRDPDAPVVAESDGKVVGFMLGEVRSGDFGLEHATGWIEVLGVDPDFRGKAVGRLMAEAMLGPLPRAGRHRGAHPGRRGPDGRRGRVLPLARLRPGAPDGVRQGPVAALDRRADAAPVPGRHRTMRVRETRGVSEQ